MMYYKERFKDFFAIDELLCLQLIGYSDADICHSFYSPQEKEALQKTIANSPKQHEKAKQILKKQTEAGVATISFYSDEYPWFAFNNLIPDAPPLLHILGDRKLLLRTDCVTIIGSRCADQAGREAAYSLARKLTLEGHVIVSGLAAGCDTAAHRGCLGAGGKTIAFVGSGLDITHPKTNRPLQEEIIRCGRAIVSEHPFGVKANPRRLIARCRFQSVMSSDVIVAQCPIVSGTMYTVFFTQEYDGDIWGWENTIYAVEYDTYNELSSGNEFLLKYNLAVNIKKP